MKKESSVDLQMTSNLDIALEYAELGIPVMPLRWQSETLKNGAVRKAKSPCWKNYADKVTLDLSLIKRVWGEDPQLLVGILTGRMNGFDVVDIDRHGDSDGFKTLKQMGLQCRSPLRAKTAGNGEHFFFAHTPCLWSSNGDVGPGIDIKSEAATGPVTVLFRSFKSIFCRKGDKPWQHDLPKNSNATQCALH